MILSETVNVVLNNANIKYLIGLGYDTNNKTEIEVKVEHLSKGSHTKIYVKCDVCGITEKWLTYKDYLKNVKKYDKYCCCHKCAMFKVKLTLLENHGDENYINTDKIKETMLKNHGVDNPSKSEKFKEKRRNTMLDKFGSENFFTSEYFLENVNYYQCYENKDYFDKMYLHYKSFGLELIGANGKNLIFKCSEHGIYEISANTLSKRINFYKTTACIHCNPIKQSPKSAREIELYNYINSIYIDDIICNDREIIEPNELDIYLPKITSAFEFNGVYWHSLSKKDDNYHIKKTTDCDNKNIKLYHVWEHDWVSKKEIIKSNISFILNKNENYIDLNECEIKVIKLDEKIVHFLNINFIDNDNVKTTEYCVGIYSNNILSLLIGIDFKNENSIEFKYICSNLYNSILNFSEILDFLKYEYQIKHIYIDIDRAFPVYLDMLIYSHFNIINYINPETFYIIKNKFYLSVDEKLDINNNKLINCGKIRLEYCY